jgi:hypothetical protein
LTQKKKSLALFSSIEHRTTMAAIISFLGEQLYALNPSLLPTPPEQQGSDQDVCFLGPNGEEDAGSVTLCGELPDGMRPNIGSWYLSPDRHVVEGLLVLVFCGTLVSKIQPLLMKRIQNSTTQIRHPFWVKPVTVFCFGMIVWYKLQGYSSKMYYLVMPCNMKWILCMILCFGPQQYQPIVLELLCSYFSLAMVALATPDTTDTILPGEFTFFFANHAILLLIPLAYIHNGSITTKTPLSTHFLWWTVACCWFALLYFPVVSVLGTKSGLNLNYMMHPPPNQTLVAGDWYRFTSTALCAFMFFLSRAIVFMVEYIIMPAKPKMNKIKQMKRV